MTASVYLNRIATAVPHQDVHAPFVGFAEQMLQDERTRGLFLRMAKRSGIEHRYSSLDIDGSAGALPEPLVNAGAFYRYGAFPSTAQRMCLFERFAPALARRALDRLALSSAERRRVGHIVVTCCTGLYAPGLDAEVIDYLDLDPSTDRTMIGFMGCYAAVNGLKLARHIVRSEPAQSVLLLNLELCTLHLQETQDLGEVLSFLVFADGCAASLISSDAEGVEMERFQAVPLANTRELITWKVRDQGFDMVLSGRVPGEIANCLRARRSELTGLGGCDVWAVHPGGRSVLDAVEEGLQLAPEALAASRSVLAKYGNMSSATVMFVLQEVMRRTERGERGVAMSFGPGLTAETMRFHAV